MPTNRAATSTNNPTTDNPAPIWHQRVAEIRIYPSTRFVQRQGKSLLLAEIQFIDAMGDPMKAPGHLRCTLFAAQPGAAAGNATGTQLGAWSISLTTLAEQKQYYDPISQAYKLPLALAPAPGSAPATGKPSLLQVVFTPVAGQRIQTQRRLPIKW